MFDKVLVANRGAIAVRIMRTLKRMQIGAVAVYAAADADSLHVVQADEAWPLGEGGAAKTYLDQDQLFDIIKRSGVAAVHPGYGFLSENAAFVARCERAGVAFIGPTAAQMAAFGQKHRARALAERHGVPLLPGSGLLRDLEHALDAAQVVGYPVMLKTTAGGGGIGMQRCHDADELRRAYETVRRLGENNFADGGMFLEKFIERARHIEVQIFGDGRGRAIAIGERDCSTQRRNQKVIEETPAPNLSPALRAALHETAVRLVSAVDYRNAGTVEFVIDQATQAFYFLEVNTRLQVEHGVTEQVYEVDLVEWMVRQAADAMDDLDDVKLRLRPCGHAIQARIYAEDPTKQFQPCAGALSQVQFRQQPDLRIDTWVESGVEVSALFDPLLAKLIAHGADRTQAIARLDQALATTTLYGIETNLAYLRAILRDANFIAGHMATRDLAHLAFHTRRIEVVAAGTMTTIQDYPGRIGYWNIGVPPSGPFDEYSFQLGNRLLENPTDAAGLEFTLSGPTLRFTGAAQIVLNGATMSATLDEQPLPYWTVIDVPAGATLKLGKIIDAGARAYLLVKGGIRCPDYLGAKATFTLGQFGGHNGRALRSGDVLSLGTEEARTRSPLREIPQDLRPAITRHWTLRTIYGPHGAPDFFTPADIERFFDSTWEVHYHSSRTGIRLIGPKPQWARSDGGEAGMHPSNIHDNAYAIGAVDFTGDMPVILGPDGPSLGGFVCPATVIAADRWKLGQLKAGDRIRFEAVSVDDAARLAQAQRRALADLVLANYQVAKRSASTPILHRLSAAENGIDVVYRAAGDRYLLVEYGAPVLDIALRFRVHALMLWLEAHKPDGLLELTPGIRSLQVHYDPELLGLTALMALLRRAEQALAAAPVLEVPSRIVHLPLSWDDTACQLAINKYMQSVRKDAPWCPSNIEFIRRINGLENIEQVRAIVFAARYLVMGLGDVYLGAPVATPLDPRHRLVTTKYNPARTWTAENSVGIGGSYLCIYGMEGPGGYQFIGRTLQMWNRYRKTREFEQPWLLRFFDQIQFYPVTASELAHIRREFPRGRYPLKIEPTRFSLVDYQAFLTRESTAIEHFTRTREQAFRAELQRWVASGQMNFETETGSVASGEAETLPEHCIAVESPVAGSVWEVLVQPGERIAAGQPLLILESMKMEIEVTAPAAGTVHAIMRTAGSQIGAGQSLLVLREE